MIVQFSFWLSSVCRGMSSTAVHAFIRLTPAAMYDIEGFSGTLALKMLSPLASYDFYVPFLIGSVSLHTQRYGPGFLHPPSMADAVSFRASA